jgi:hypothetical protein
MELNLEYIKQELELLFLVRKQPNKENWNKLKINYLKLLTINLKLILT